MQNQAFLSVRGDQIVNREGRAVLLRGFGLGGWMNMENFITGYPANEEAQREAVRDVLGEAKYEFFYDRFLDYFFRREDAQYIRSLGLNLVRLPLNYRHFEDDMNPFVIKEAGFKYLDRAIDLCAEQGLYTILDLHALPGYQNQDWHSDNPTHKALFWRHKQFQDRVVRIWEVLAERYRHNPWVAGYNPINEPADPTEKMVVPFYRRLVDAIRAVDPEHIIFLEGNRYSADFHVFSEPWENVVYTNHDYALPGFMNGGPYPGYTQGEYVDKESLQQTFLRRSEYMLKHKLHIWVGEFGPVYTGDPAKDAMRYQILRDQLEVYDYYRTSWSIWLYKDIGVQGVVYASPASPYMQRIGAIVEKKARLGADAWSTTDERVRDVVGPLEALVEREFPNYAPFPFGAKWYINRLVRHILLSEPLVAEYAACFRGMSENEIDTMMRSFCFEQCVQRTELAQILAEHAG